MNHSIRPRCGFTRIDLSVTLLILLASVGLLLPACNKAIDTSNQTGSENNLKIIGLSTKQSENNLMQMCLGIHQMAAPTDAPLPPSYGMYPRGGPVGTIFFHLLPSIEQNNTFITYKGDPNKIPATVTIKTYCSPSDPSNPGNTALCSYASNEHVFGSNAGTPMQPVSGTMRISQLSNGKGTSYTVFFFEHYAQPVKDDKGGTISNYWFSRSTALYPATEFNRNAWMSIKNPQFDVTPTQTAPLPDNDTAHAFVKNTLMIGLGDGSAKKVTKDITKSVNFPLEGGRPIQASLWQWACAGRGELCQAPPPDGW